MTLAAAQFDLIDYINTPRPTLGGHSADPRQGQSERATGCSSSQSGRADFYPHHAGWKDPTTSRDAAVAIEASGRAENLRARALFVLRRPMTPKEVADALSEEITSIRPRLTELMEQGLIERTGDRRDKQHVMVAL